MPMTIATRPARAIDAFATVALIVAVAFGAVLMDRPPGNPGVAAAQFAAAPASPTSTIKSMILLFVRSCPAGYDALSASADPSTDCTAVPTDAVFTLSHNGISLVTKPVLAQGWVDYFSLDAGQYEVTETMPSGVTSAFIDHCISQDRSYENFPFKPVARVGSDGRLIINILDRDKFTCTWYNVPANSVP